MLHFLDPSSPISWEHDQLDRIGLCKTLALIIIIDGSDDDDDDDGSLEDPTARIVIPRKRSVSTDPTPLDRGGGVHARADRPRLAQRLPQSMASGSTTALYLVQVDRYPTLLVRVRMFVMFGLIAAVVLSSSTTRTSNTGITRSRSQFQSCVALSDFPSGFNAILPKN